MKNTTAKLIVLRGPSGSGKTTVAEALQQSSSKDLLIIDQDYYRHILLANKPDEKHIVPELIYHNVITALKAGYNVIVEGIFKKEKYKPMFERLVRDFDGETYIYYFDITFGETVRRHETRVKSVLFSAKDMKEWYGMAEPLSLESEHRIPEYSSEEDTIKLIRHQTKL